MDLGYLELDTLNKVLLMSRSTLREKESKALYHHHLCIFIEEQIRLPFKFLGLSGGQVGWYLSSYI